MTENRYTTRIAMINSGRFWRCPHGYTVFTDDICWRCAAKRPVAFLRYAVRRIKRIGGIHD